MPPPSPAARVVPTLASLCLLLTACAPTPRGGDDPDPDAVADVGDALDAAPDTAPDAARDAAPDAMPDALPDAAPPPCGPTGETWEVDPFGPDGQIHPALAADGDGVWVAYNRVTPGLSTFDVFVTRVACDGRATVLPFEVSADETFSDTDPSIAVGPDAVLVTWTNDVSDADPNLVARYRLLDRAGEPLGAPRALVTQRAGGDFGGGQWMVQAAATDNGFVIVGARGVDDRSAFQFFAQRLDGSGAPVGPTASAERDMLQQLDPDVAVAADGTIIVAWGEGDQGAGAIVGGTWAPPYDGDLRLQQVLPAPAGGVRLSTGRRALAAAVLPRNGGADIAVRDLDDDTGVDLGEPGQIDLQPGVAQLGAVALVAWFRRIRGNRAGLWVQTLELTGQLRARGPARAIPLQADAAPYPMAIAPLPDGRAAIAWAAGESPAFRIYWRVEAP